MMPSGPGADFLLLFPRICLMSHGLMGEVLKGEKLVLSGDVGRCGNQVCFEKSISL